MGLRGIAVVCGVVACVAAMGQLVFRDGGQRGGAIGSFVQHPLRAPLPTWHPAAKVDASWQLARPLPVRERPQNLWVQNTGTVEVDLRTGRPVVKPMAPVLEPGEGKTEGFPGSTAIHDQQNPIQPMIVIGPDGRKKVGTTTLYPWRTMVKLKMRFDGQDYIGSGIMVSRTHVLTAAHCVYDANLGGYADRIEVAPGLNGTFAPYGTALAKNMRTFSGWINGESTDWDMALITVDRNIGASCGFMGMANYTTTALNKQYITIGGYPFDKDGGNSLYYMSGGLLRVEPHQLHYTIDTAGGQSGSGIWRVVSGQRYVIGVHAFGVSGSTPYNGGTRLETQKYNQVKTWIASGS